ncbi:phospholipase A2 family protein [Wolffia australiana]
MKFSSSHFFLLLRGALSAGSGGQSALFDEEKKLSGEVGKNQTGKSLPGFFSIPKPMNFRFPGDLSFPPLFSLPWRSSPDPKPHSSLFPFPSLSSGSSDFNLKDAIFNSFKSFLCSGWNPFARFPLRPKARSNAQESVSEIGGCGLQLFRPYVAKVPWHGGPRAFLSQLFPRYGHYCGPNWSSGKDNGLPLWDRRPIDWLDFCCYCHDIGYDTHDQAKLLQADLAFLECLERPRMSTKGDAHAAYLYKTMCITGLRNILIPYRMQLVRMQTGLSFFDVMNSLILKSNSCSQGSGKVL